MTDALKHVCSQFRSATRSLVIRIGVARLVSFTLLAAGLLVLIDYLWHFQSLERWLGFVVLLGVVGSAVYFDLLRPLSHQWTDEQVLDYIDLAMHDGQDRLTNLAELSKGTGVVEASGPQGRALMERAVQELAGEISKVHPGGLFRRTVLSRWLTIGAVVLGAWLLLGGVFQFATRYPYTRIGVVRLLPWVNLNWPDSTQIQLLSPEDGAQVPEGEDLVVRARIAGRLPDQVTLVYHGLDAKGHRTTRAIEQTMTVDQEGVAAYTFKELNDAVELQVRGGDGHSDWVTIGVTKRPFIASIEARYKPPSYSGILQTPGNSGNLTGLEGTEVLVIFNASTPLAKAWLTLDGDPAPKNLKLSGDGLRFEWPTMLSQNGKYTVCIQDRFGNRERRAERYSIQVDADREPEGRITAPLTDLTVTKNAHFRIAYTANDDYGLKMVRVRVTTNDDSPTTAPDLDEKITGPIRQSGKESMGSFEWDLAKMDLAGVRKLTYYVACQDVNPVRDRVSVSNMLQLFVKTDTEVQDNATQVFRLLMTECVLGAENQKLAMFDAGYWVNHKDPVGTEADALLRQMKEEQEIAERAATKMLAHFKTVIEEMERNRLSDAMFQRRLDQIGLLIAAMAQQRQPDIAKVIAGARPTNAAEDTPKGRTAKMKAALLSVAQQQKIAALEYEQLLNLLRDWNDLQLVLIKSKQLRELQTGVLQACEALPKEFIGLERADIKKDEDVRRLEIIGQQEDAIFQAESALDEQLQTLYREADSQGRKAVADPLRECFKLIRLRSIREKIFECSRAIKDNRADATLQEQQYVINVFNFLVTRFEAAGRDVPTVVTIDAARVAAAKFEDARLKATTVVTTQPVDVVATIIDTQSRTEDILPPPPANSIEEALVLLQGVMDEQVKLYTAYTDQRFTQAPRSPRYRALRLGMLSIRCDRAIEAMDKALGYAKKHDFKEIDPYLQALRADLVATQKLIAAGLVNKPSQDYIDEEIASIQASLRFLLLRAKAVDEVTAHEQGKGKDSFGQEFVVQGKDLQTLREVREQLGWAVVLQSDVRWKALRVAAAAESKETPDQFQPVLAVARKVASDRQAAVVKLVSSAMAQAKTIDAKHQQRLAAETQAIVLGQFGAAASDLAGGKFDPKPLELLLAALTDTASNLEKLADERIRPVEKPAEAEVVVAKALQNVKLEDPESVRAAIDTVKKRYHAAALADRAQNTPMNPAARKLLLDSLRALADNPDPKYQFMISVYLDGVVDKPEDEKVKSVQETHVKDGGGK